ncbi:MAG TPA: hypothetical protein VNU49_00835 [Opitutaceae bacterium]|jgi:hypothetical protein|nr:hypothetical protein [Opitutaceae bacterium]
MNISPEEAARALGEIEASRAAMRTVIRSNRGHYFLWLWGGLWAVAALLVEFKGLHSLLIFRNWLMPAGIVVTFLILLCTQGKIRSPLNKRFIGVLATTVIFAFIWPLVLRGPGNARNDFAYGALMAMFCYIVAGIWFDVYLLRVGLLVSAILLASLFFFPALFWWSVVLSGVTLIGTGFYVRYFWR